MYFSSGRLAPGREVPPAGPPLAFDLRWERRWPVDWWNFWGEWDNVWLDDTTPDSDRVSAYTRRWARWERANETYWDHFGARWGEELEAEELCVHCGMDWAAYSAGSCRTCYRWLARNRDKFGANELFTELAKRVALRRARQSA